jgi:hypothetical protein
MSTLMSHLVRVIEDLIDANIKFHFEDIIGELP